MDVTKASMKLKLALKLLYRVDKAETSCFLSEKYYLIPAKLIENFEQSTTQCLK